MALNGSHHENGGLVVFLGENILCYHDGVELDLGKVDNDLMTKGTKKGRAYLTTHRVIFVAKDNGAPLKSFAMGFCSMKGVELEQPVFGANYLRGTVRAEPGGKWTGEAEFKMRFYKGGCIEFGMAMLKAASLVSRFTGPQFSPPPYSYEDQRVHPARPDMYVPPPGQYGWIPQGDVFYPPPAYGVFYADAPPPYPGVNGAYNGGAFNGGAYNNGGAFNGGAFNPGPPPMPNGFQPPVNPQFATNGQQAYYDPNNPGTVFAPPAYSYANPSAPPPPPSYDAAVGKKND